MLKIKVMTHDDLEHVSRFISELNRIEESHIGYCAKNKDEIKEDFINNISDIKFTNSFIVAYEGETLIGVLGFDADLENETAEIWGPFIVSNKWDIAKNMWEQLIELVPNEINSLLMFPNVKNTRACELANRLSFEKYSDETILVFEREQSHELQNVSIQELNPEYISSMKQLHNEAFPNAYYNGQQIIERLNKYRKVFIITNEKGLSGYIYVEAEPDFGGASIEFFAVHESERGKGIGSELLRGALKWLFTFKEIESIRLCVSSNNKNAINLYQKVGFKHQHDLYAYVIIIKESHPNLSGGILLIICFAK